MKYHDQITRKPLDDLLPYARNARTHSDGQIAQIAASMREWGWTNPVLVMPNGTIVAGHGRVMAARLLGISDVPCIVAEGWTESQMRAYVIADNKLALNAGWDVPLLRLELQDLDTGEFDLELTGFSAGELEDLLTWAPDGTAAGLTDPDDIPDLLPEAVSQAGDIWILGNHRLMCGDSTIAGDVAALMNGNRAALLHADPPYGMGKQADGVANDNLYGDKLDTFQMRWWATFRPSLEDNASCYIWGNAPDLWRLWWRGGLGDSETLHMCNHITWDKKSIAGMASDLMLQYPIATEHCLFFKLGVQFVGSINADQYWEGWDVIRVYLKEQADAAGLTPTLCKEITGVGMYAHWFSKSQWAFMPQRYYELLQRALDGYFAKPYADLRKQYEEIKGGYRHHINGMQSGMRSYFDNAHEVMRDVWEFSRVTGEERYGHATPKPVDMIARTLKSSLPTGGLCAEPFSGSGTTLIAAEKTGRRCYAMELSAQYVDVAVRRWQQFTGKRAVLESTGEPFPDESIG